jgi:hypothetical protein
MRPLTSWVGNMDRRTIMFAMVFAFLLGWAAADVWGQTWARPECQVTTTDDEPFWTRCSAAMERASWHTLCRELVRRPNPDQELLQTCLDMEEPAPLLAPSEDLSRRYHELIAPNR